MSLSTEAIDRLFNRLSATYGAAWERSHGTNPMSDVKAAWTHELSGFGNSMKSIAWALENLPERCPNVIEFRNLCRRAPLEEVKLLPVVTDPEKVAAELLRLGELRSKVAVPAVSQREWAHRIIRRHEAGETVRPISLEFAREALGTETRRFAT
ncbi:hypothetical protein [Xylophilus sp. GOD-11R]|uniref:hypothetical protein n=1 Tax=Xylophilus sp. GOD-11R TaxID=3089814 RepID=UPI00298D3DBC|nr:hypothetical protein [Xylophilus sp. GOD-11R]WPB58617.1 hypothetical protein R9X41_08275 [Xylophilus sp. GOD-11R]